MSAINIDQLNPPTRKYLDLWIKQVAEGLSRLAGVAVSAEPAGEESSQDAETAPADGVWIRLFAGKAGEQAFFLGAADALRLSQLLMGGSSGEAAALTPDGKESVIQFFQQIATMIPASDLLGYAVELEVSEGESPQWESAGQATFHFTTPQGPFLLRARLSADFAATLQSAQGEPKKQRKPQPAATPLAAPHDINLDLLMDVELEVTFRFGQREMLLGDILNLAPGSVVELDQQIQDPVELMIGNKVIAWGEVVSVDGNYGLRVTGLASREERLESLRK